MNNREIRALAAERRVKMWQIADTIGIADMTFSKWMRRELPEDKKRQALEAIEAIAAKRGG